MRRSITLVTLAVLCGCAAESSSVAPSASASASHKAAIDDPSAVTYAAWQDTTFTVIVSAEADALFEEVTRCTSEEYGFSVAYPASWFTNEGGQAPGCSWFSPQPFAQAQTTLVALSRPEDTPIGLTVVRTMLGRIPEWPMLLTEAAVIGGLGGGRSEILVPGPTPEFMYDYTVWLDPNPEGLKFMAGTSSASGGDYVLHKAVLDRMMASLEFMERQPAPPPPSFIEGGGYSFTVAESAAADRLFETPDTCTNPVDGYQVTFPDDWYTNTAIGETPACSWFTPDFFEVIDPDLVPGEIWISIETVDGVIAYTGLTEILLREEILVGGMTARRVESNPRPNDRPDYRVYDYAVNLGSPDHGPSFLASVDSDTAGDYELARAVLDRMMATLEFTHEAP